MTRMYTDELREFVDICKNHPEKAINFGKHNLQLVTQCMLLINKIRLAGIDKNTFAYAVAMDALDLWFVIEVIPTLETLYEE